MHIRQLILTFFILLTTSTIYGQKKFKVVVKETETWRSIYSFVDTKGKTFRQLDTSNYYTCFTTDTYVYFAIFGKKDFKGWAAMNSEEKVVFNVYNTSFGEPTPDDIIENKIRIVDSNNLIGFANKKGQIIIKPKFEIATSFYNGKAIIGQNCEKVLWGEHLKESDCHHYSIVCKRHGYINEKGVVKKIGAFSFEKIVKEINWKAPDFQMYYSQ